MARREFSEADGDRFAAGRRELLEEWQAKLTGRVADLVNGDGWQAWLDVASRFSSYSFRNSVLIMMQRPDATAVAGFRAWQTSFGRQVNRGETGIKILAPVTRRVEKTVLDGRPVLDEHGVPVKATQLVGVRLVTVFDISQTSGPDLPSQPEPVLLRGEAPSGLWDSLQQLVEGKGFRLSRGDCDGANGWTDFTTNEVRVRSDIANAAAVKTLAHEAGHVLLHSTVGLAGEQVCRGRREVEAESVAYLVTKAHGSDVGTYTFNYMAGWADPALRSAPEGTTLADIVTETGSRVVTAADTILQTTKPVRPIDQLSTAVATSVEKSIVPDRTSQMAIQDSIRRSAAQHPPTQAVPSMARQAAPIGR